MTEEQRAELEKLEVRLKAVRYVREGRDDRDFVCDTDCDADEDGARPVAVNPSGPEAAKTIKDLLATIARLEAEKVKDGEAMQEVLDGMIASRNDISVDDWIDTLGARLSSRAKDQSQ